MPPDPKDNPDSEIPEDGEEPTLPPDDVRNDEVDDDLAPEGEVG